VAVVFADSAGKVQSRPPQAEMEIVFRPAPGGAHIAVGVSGAPVREIPGDTPRDPSSSFQDAAVSVRILPVGSDRPLVTAARTRFPAGSERVMITGFTIPPGSPAEWRCLIRNVGSTSILCDALVTFTALQRRVEETPIAKRLLNGALAEVIRAVGVGVRFDGSRATVGVSPELREVAGDAVADRTFDIDAEIHDVNLDTLKVEAITIPNGRPGLRLHIDFETIGPVELERSFELPIASIGPIALRKQLTFGFDLRQARLEIVIELTTEGALDRRRIVPRLVSIEPRVEVEGNDVVEFLRDVFDVLDTTVPRLEVPDFDDVVSDQVTGQLRAVLTSTAFRDAVGGFLTESLQFLVDRDHRFHGLRADGRSFVVEHVDPAAPPEAPTTPPPPPTPPSPPSPPPSQPPPTPPTPPGGGGGDDPPRHVPFAGVGAAAAAAGPADDALARLRRIDTIVVLMLENRSFDHILGHLALGGQRRDIDGLTGRETNSAPGNVTVGVNPLVGTSFLNDPAHDIDEVARQIAGGAMSGFLASYVDRFPTAELAGQLRRTPLSYLTEAQLWATDFLAEHYLTCNRWFCSFPGATQPNRFCTLSGRTDVRGNYGAGDDGLGYVRLPTIFEALTVGGVDWVYYEHDVAFLRFYDRYRIDSDHVLPIGSPDPQEDTPEGDGFFARARRGTLPPVVFIDPDFVQIPPRRLANDDHPPSDVGRGQALIASVYDALVRQPGDRFARTLLVITYDEHGGFYDHVPPPGSHPPMAGAMPVGGGFLPIGRPNGGPPVHPETPMLGPRVPTMVISPQVAAGASSNVMFDHTSIGRTILLRFLGPDAPFLGPRMHVANHLGQLLAADIRADRPVLTTTTPPVLPDDDRIPDGGHVPFSPRRSRARDERDFHEAIRRFGRRPTGRPAAT
jgi:phospholipase C